jgi:outer membrane immunogenic protein
MKIVKKLGLAGVVGIAAISAGAAVAADVPVAYRPPATAFVTPPVPTWTGFYIGGNLGSGWDRGSSGISATSTDPTLAPALAAILAAGSYPDLLSPSGKGVIGGGQVGYNWQLASQALIGLEADFQGSGIKGSADQVMSPGIFDMTTTDVSKSIEWFGTVRGRVGYLVAPQWLLYATGGFAYGQTKTSFSTTDLTVGCVPGPGGTLCAAGTSSSMRTGWTAGGGVEAQLTPNWSIKAEYLYVDLGASTLSVPTSTLPAIVFSMSTSLREQIARVGFNYRFDWSGPVVARY